MSELLMPSTRAAQPSAAAVRLPRRTRPEAGNAARGIMLALALSSVAWVGIALLVPRLW
jgi:hypothetical protein